MKRIVMVLVASTMVVALFGGVALARTFTCQENPCRGTDMADVIRGTENRDTIFAQGGDDTVSGRASADNLQGQAGDDTVNGGTGNDTIRGQSGNDVLRGGQGSDTIRGQMGDDTITGGSGSDIISGGFGNDTIFSRDGVVDDVDCGPGNDIANSDTFDQITRCEVVNN